MTEKETIIKKLSQTWDMPSKLTPIVIVGAGGIVNDAHLPAYKKAGFKVKGIYDIDKSKAQDLAKKFNIDKVFETLEEAIEDKECIFDLALPPANLLDVVSQLPEDSFAILQKPLGRTLEEGREILNCFSTTRRFICYFTKTIRKNFRRRKRNSKNLS